MSLLWLRIFCSLCFAFRLIVVRSLSGHIYNRRQYISHPNIINMWNTLHNDSRYIGESRWMKSLTDHKKNGFVFFHVASVVWFGSKFSWARMVFSLNYWARRYLLLKSWRERKKRRGKNINLNQDTQNEDKNHTKDSIISQSHGGSTKISIIRIERTCSKKNGGIKSTIQLENSFVYHDMTNIPRKKMKAHRHR